MDIFRELLIDLTKKKDLGVLSSENFKKIQRVLVTQKAKMRGKSEEDYIRWIESMRQKYIEEEEDEKEKPPITQVKKEIPIIQQEKITEEPPITEVEEEINEESVKENSHIPEKELENVKEPDSSKKPVVPSETLDDGNCFYSSIYRALKEARLLEKLKRCYISLDLTTENTFIQTWRDVVAGEVEKGKVAGDIYDLLLSVVKEKATYKQILEAQPDWFRKLYSRGLPEKNVFFKKTAEKVRIMNNWAAELEVTLTKELLEVCNIELVTHNSQIAEAATHTEDGKPIIHLWNQGEAHWIRFSFDEVTPEYLESGEYITLKESLCENECKSIEIRLESAQKAIEGSEKAIQTCEKEIVLHTARLEENKEKVVRLVEELDECKKKCGGELKGGSRKVKKNNKSKRVSRKKLCSKL
jgi:hypothetical protein